MKTPRSQHWCLLPMLCHVEGKFPNDNLSELLYEPLSRYLFLLTFAVPDGPWWVPLLPNTTKVLGSNQSLGYYLLHVLFMSTWFSMHPFQSDTIHIQQIPEQNKAVAAWWRWMSDWCHCLQTCWCIGFWAIYKDSYKILARWRDLTHSHSVQIFL